jgi:hypothetical protein
VCRASMPALGSLLHTPCHLIRHPWSKDFF